MPTLRKPPRLDSSHLTTNPPNLEDVGRPLLQNLLTTVFVLSFCPTNLSFLQYFPKTTKSFSFNSRRSGSQYLTFRLYVHFLPDICGGFQSWWLSCWSPKHLDIFPFHFWERAYFFYTLWPFPNPVSWAPNLLTIFLDLNHTFIPWLSGSMVDLCYAHFLNLEQRNSMYLKAGDPP